MPTNELETHPYLFDQVNDFKDKNQITKYCKLIVGTFPIYAITNSDPPVGSLGEQIRANWFDYAFLQYFYGSRGSYFWELFATAFNEPVPVTRQAAIELLNKYKFLMTDVFVKTCRRNYSPLDNDLVNSVYNQGIINLIQNSNNLKIIYFTSKTAKKKFCRIVHIPFVNLIDNLEVIFDRVYRMIVLISPAGGGRTVPHFFNDFPLTAEEINLINMGQTYAYSYRLRYYSHYLPIPCH